MAILTAILYQALELKNVLNALDFIPDNKYARFKACKQGFYFDIQLDGIIFTLGLRPEWFLYFNFTDQDSIPFPFSFDFNQFLNCVRAVDDNHCLELCVSNNMNVVVFELNSYDSAGINVGGEHITSKPSPNKLDNLVRTFEDINIMFRPKAKLFSADLATRLLGQSIRDRDSVDVYLTNHLINLRTSMIRHPSLVFDTILGESCSIICFDNPLAKIFTRLHLYEAPYLQQALTGTDVEAIELIYPPWPGQMLSNLILRLWFTWNAHLDIEFPCTCKVRPEITLYPF